MKRVIRIALIISMIFSLATVVQAKTSRTMNLMDCLKA